MSENDTMQTRKIKCPHCGWVRNWWLRVDGHTVDVVMGGGLSDALKKLKEKIQEMARDTELEEANAWLDLPECPKCGQVYQYNLRTGVTR